MADLTLNPIIKDLIAMNVIERIIFLDENKKGNIKEIYFLDKKNKEYLQKTYAIFKIFVFSFDNSYYNIHRIL